MMKLCERLAFVAIVIFTFCLVVAAFVGCTTDPRMVLPHPLDDPRQWKFPDKKP